MNKKLLSVLVTAAIGAGFATQAAAEATTLKVTSGLWSKPNEQQFIREEILPVFTEETGIKVEMDVLAGSDIMKLMKSQRDSGKWDSDIVMTHSGDMPTFIGNEFVQPLDNVAEKLDVTFMDAFSSATTDGGNTYYLPISADVYLVVANKKAMPYLPEGAEVESLTWEQYTQWGKNIAADHGAKISMPSQTIKSLLYQVGGIGLSHGAGFPEINTEGMNKSWSLVADMLASESVLKTSMNYGDPVEQMKAGEAWLSFFHMAPVGDIYSSAPAKYVVAPAPAGPNGNGSIAGAWGIGITAGADDMSAAEQFIEYMTSPEVLYDISVNTGGFIPPVEEVVAELGQDPEDLVILKGLETLKNGVVSGVPASEYKDWGAVKTVYDSVFASIQKTGKVSQAELDAQQAELEALKK